MKSTKPNFYSNFIGDLHKIAKRSTSTIKDWLQIAPLNVRSIFQPRPDPAQDRLINLFAQSRRRPRLINSLESRDNLLQGRNFYLKYLSCIHIILHALKTISNQSQTRKRWFNYATKLLLYM